jgi:EmrB/QacA subfamily drug resistance transporter
VSRPAGERFGPAVQYALLAGPLLAMLDSSIVNVAVQPIGRELSSPLTTVQWAVSGYLLAMGAGLAATPWLSRRLGGLSLYRAALIAFTLASAACAFAPTVPLLIAARGLQGLVAAPLVPIAMTMLLGRGDTRRSISPLAGIMLFAGPALGPGIGGALIDAAGWRAVFFINVPLGVLAAVAATRLPARLVPGREPAARFDLPGLLLLAGGLTVLLLGIDQGGTRGWTSRPALLPLIAGVALLIAYAIWADRRPHPALDLSPARSRPAALALVLSAVASIVTYAAIFLLPVFVQGVQGHDALSTGLALLPQGIITGLSTALGDRLLSRVTVRVTVLAGFAVLTVAGLGLLAIDRHTPLPVTAAILAVRAASIGLVITPLLAVLLRPLAAARLPDANTLFNIWQRIAGSIGIGLIAALYADQTRAHGPVSALHTTGLVVVVLSAVGALIALALPRIPNKMPSAAEPSIEPSAGPSIEPSAGPSIEPSAGSSAEPAGGPGR